MLLAFKTSRPVDNNKQHKKWIVFHNETIPSNYQKRSINEVYL
jgi:hypothetical protein